MARASCLEANAVVLGLAACLTRSNISIASSPRLADRTTDCGFRSEESSYVTICRRPRSETALCEEMRRCGDGC
eukprot:3062762-Pyramimonas_sp.AAC.1